MKELYLDPKQKEILITRAITLLGTGFDEIFFTPPRVLQVFFQDIFSKLFGPTHTLASGLFLVTSFIANLSYFAKLFNKNEINTLEEVLANCEKEFGIKYNLEDIHQKSALEAYFNKDLVAKHRGYLTASITKNKKNQWDLKYTLSEKLTAILKSENLTYAQARATLNDQTDKDIIAFLDKIIPDKDGARNKTIGQLRQEALNKLSASAGDVASNTADFIVNDVPFQYWLWFFFYDITSNNDDAASWGLGKTLITIGGAIAISTVKFAGKIYQYFKNKFKAEDRESEFSSNNSDEAPKPIKHKNNALKHQQLTTFFLDALDIHNARANKAVDSANGIEFVRRPSKPWHKKLASKFYKFFKTKSSTEHIDLLQAEIDPNSTSFRRKANSVTLGVTNPMIQSSFFEWVITVATPVFSNMTRVTDFFKSAASNLVDLGAVVLGGIIGAIYYRFKTKPKLDKEKEKLAAQVNCPKTQNTFEQIEELEKFSNLLKHAIKNLGYKSPNVAHAYDDRTHRRLTTEKTQFFTSLKKFLNRLAMFIGRWGTGVLLVRITLLSALKALAVFLSATTFAAVSAIAFPIVMGIALGVGLLWGAIYLYKYTVDQRLEEAKQFLADKDIRLEAAKKTFHTYKNCLEKLQPGHEVFDEIKSTNERVSEIINEKPTIKKLPKPADYKVSYEKLGLFHNKNKPSLNINTIDTNKEAVSAYLGADLDPHPTAAY